MTDDEIEKEFNQLIVFGYIRNVENINNYNDNMSDQLQIPTDLYNLILKYYWIPNNDTKWSYIGNIKMPFRKSCMRDDRSGFVLIQDCNKVNNKKEFIEQNYVLMFFNEVEDSQSSNRYPYKYDINQNEFTQCLLKSDFPASNHHSFVGVYCEKNQQIHIFSNKRKRVHHSIKLKDLLV